MGILASDQITITDVTDGYAVILTSETYTFVEDSSGGTKNQSCTTEAVAYCGSNQCSAVNVSEKDIVCPTGITAEVSNSGSSKVKIAFKTSANLTGACEATIPVIVDGIIVNKKFSFAVAKAGATGATGPTGKDGTDGIVMSVTASHGTIFKTNAGNTVLTAHIFNGGVEQSINGNGVCGDLGTVKWYKAGTSSPISASGSITAVASDITTTVTYTVQLENSDGIKATTQITISKVIDVYAVTRYYMLQSSSSATPSKPATNPPAGWSDTEPAYVSGSTNTLYFVDCNVYSDKTFSFSEVSKSSTYEAAKDAWNKANNAQESIDNLEIGGRNLARKTSNEYNNPPYTNFNGVNNICPSLARVYLKGLSVGDRVTVRLVYKYTNIVAVTGKTAAVWLQGNGNITGYTSGAFWNSPHIVLSGSGEKIIKYSFVVTSDMIKNQYWDVNIRHDGIQSGSVQWKEFKVEKGNIATDWTPAPEDAIDSVSTEYYLSTSAISLSGGSWSATAPTWVNGKYMWSRTVITDGAGNKSYSPNQNGVCIAGAKGDKGDTGAAGKGVKSASVTYQSSTSGTTIPTGTWVTSIPSVATGSFLWTKTTITYTDDSTTTSYSVGKMGNTGATGKGVKSTAITYQSSIYGTTVPTGTWQSSIPTVAAGSFLWTRTIITYTDNSTSTSYSIGKIGEKGDKGDKGDPGNAGKDAIIISSTAPTSPKTGQLWQTASGEPIKRWDGSKWVLYYISVENLDVQKLSAIAADLGTVTAGVIKNKADTVNFDVERGVFESWDTDILQSAKMSAGTFEVSAKDSSDSYVKTYLNYCGLYICQINKSYGYSIVMEELGGDLLVSKLINNGRGNETVSLFKNLKRTPVAGSKVVTITKGKNYVKLMTASEAAGLLGIADGTSGAVSLAVSNGDAHVFNARTYGAEYWNTDSTWYVYFNVTASITQLVRVNYILAPTI